MIWLQISQMVFNKIIIGQWETSYIPSTQLLNGVYSATVAEKDQT